MARLDLDRITQRLIKALHQELLDYKLGPLGPETSAEPDITYQQLTMPVPIEQVGLPKAVLQRAAWTLAREIRNGQPSYIARMPMPTQGDASRCDNEEWGLSVLVQFKKGDVIHPFGLLVVDVVAGPPKSSVH